MIDLYFHGNTSGEWAYVVEEDGAPLTQELGHLDGPMGKPRYYALGKGLRWCLDHTEGAKPLMIHGTENHIMRELNGSEKPELPWKKAMIDRCQEILAELTLNWWVTHTGTNKALPLCKYH